MTLTDTLVIVYFAVLVVAMLVLLARGGFWWRPLLILFVLSLCGLMLWYPGHYGPNQRLKPGLDLAGGTTLIYDVKVPADLDATSVIDDIIAVLQKRVDPTGTRNLVWRQIAGNRIEIQMALASPETKLRREAYHAARKKLLAGNLSENRLNTEIRADPAERDARLQALAGNDVQRQRLQELASTYDAWVAATEPYEQAQNAYNEARQSEAEAAVIKQRLEQLQASTIAFVEARKRYQEAHEKALAANVTEGEWQRLLDLDHQKADESGTTARQRATEQLIAEHTDRRADIEEALDAWHRYEQVKGPLDDPNDLIALLRGSGVLEFRIAAQPGAVDAGMYRAQLEEKGPRSGEKDPWRWFEIQDIENTVDTASERAEMRKDPAAYFADKRGLVATSYGERIFILLGNSPATAITRADEGWKLSNAGPTADELGQPAVQFSLNAIGGQLMQQLTRPHVGQPMSILLDGKIMNIANIQEALSTGVRITGGTGGFSESELRYLVRTLRAGSLEGELGEYPISIQTIGPQLGQDNLRSGLKASVAALMLVAFFILVYYFLAGAVADFALLANMIIILGIMSLIEATWTLPGIAGIVLTIGMAVDANVLIFERIREERANNADLPTAMRLGFEKAFSTILDANLTTLLVCLVLGYTATADVKGFAVVLGIGILATLFTSLFCTRAILEFFQTYAGVKSLHMLPTAIPAIGRVLSPKIDWIGKRQLFFVASVVVVLACGTAIYSRGKDMLDIEFRAGTSVSFDLPEGRSLPIEEVRKRLDDFGAVAKAMQQADYDPSTLGPLAPIHEKLEPIVTAAQQRYEQDLAEYEQRLAEEMPGGSKPEPADLSLLGEGQADVVTLGDSAGGVASAFSVSTLITDSQALSAVVKAAFDDVLDTTRPIDFASMRAQRVDAAPVYPIQEKNLGDSIDRPLVDVDVSEYLGGVAAVLEDMNPPTTIADLRQRIERMRMQPIYEHIGGRRFDVVGLPGTAAGGPGEQLFRGAVVVTRDTDTNYKEDPESFAARGGLADTEWQLVVDALQRDTSLASVSNFSPAVSGTMQGKAIMALTLSLMAVVAYIWFRFGSLRYGLAAIVALVHDVMITLGIVAVTAWVFQYSWAQALLLNPFKINLPLVAALLTIVGYSLNDTIVVFDRIRENRGRMARATAGIINDSINQTISRTVLTSGTTLIALLTLYVFGGPGVHGFAFAMLIGVLVGTYSSVAIAAPLLLLLGRGADVGGTQAQVRGAVAGEPAAA